MWQNLIQALNELSDAYEALLAIAKRKRATLVAVDLKGLEPIVEEEKQQLERIRVAENAGRMRFWRYPRKSRRVTPPRP